MDKPISVGDLVVVVKPGVYPGCTCPSTSVGEIFRVAKISFTGSQCTGCGAQYKPELAAWVEGKNRVFDLPRLKRIPPLDELEGRIEWQRIEDLA